MLLAVCARVYFVYQNLRILPTHRTKQYTRAEHEREAAVSQRPNCDLTGTASATHLGTLAALQRAECLQNIVEAGRIL